MTRYGSFLLLYSGSGSSVAFSLLYCLGFLSLCLEKIPILFHGHARALTPTPL